MLVVAGESLKGRSGHAAGRALLEKLYAQHIGGKMPEILIGQWGKPYFSEGNVHFSITHTKDHVFCALCDREVGIDAEELDRSVRPGLPKRILSAGELAQHEAAGDKNRALLTFWVLKEAAVKCTGRGLNGFPNDTDFSLEDPRVQEMDGCLVAVVINED